jgi:hypothetical protein
MCGRYTHLLTWRQIIELYGLLDAVAPNDFGPRYNIAPTQMAPVVRERDGKRECVMLRWGLIPFWAKDSKIAYKTIKAVPDSAAGCACLWCGAAFERRRGGKLQRFCRELCRRAFSKAALACAEEAVASGRLSRDALQNAPQVTRR